MAAGRKYEVSDKRGLLSGRPLAPWRFLYHGADLRRKVQLAQVGLGAGAVEAVAVQRLFLSHVWQRRRDVGHSGG